jgi:hypothetical protein
MHGTISVAVALGFIVLSNDALAASPEAEDICFDKASQRSFNGRGEREQFMANCIADLTAAPTKKRGQYKKRRYKKHQY